MKTSSYATQVACLALPFVLNAQLFTESFDYGATETTIFTVSDWVETSPYTKYDNDGGLTSAQMDGELGGSLWRDYDTSRVPVLAVDFDPFATASAGDEFWVAGLIDLAGFGTGNGQQVVFLNGESVNGFGFGVDDVGNVNVIASVGNVASEQDTGLDLTENSGTHLFLQRVVIGMGADANRESVIDFWLDPTDTSSVVALGTSDFNIASSKLGRSTGAYESLRVTIGDGSRIDEIRFGDSLTSVISVPEPSSFALLGGLFVLSLAAMRRRALV